MSKFVSYTRNTKETAVQVELDLTRAGQSNIDSSIPFLDHLLGAMAFHGRFSLRVKAKGDLEVDNHHLVEDTGLVLGEVLHRAVQERGAVQRFGHAVVPMDDALAEITLDVSGRPYFVFLGEFPQERSGGFELVLVREFLNALANRARINLHAELRYGNNSHHLSEALFKALGRVLRQAYERTDPEQSMSTKGTISG
ncbi:MAG TPA: imidazoleglycerol-phosphate dehydratase HisB [bacterium]|nr:imidazoleglycerol-phosphate dehydratase HisB [bacterium]